LNVSGVRRNNTRRGAVKKSVIEMPSFAQFIPSASLSSFSLDHWEQP
jgi:hypothetical protein